MKHLILAAVMVAAFASQASAYSPGLSWGFNMSVGEPSRPAPPAYYYPPPPPRPVVVVPPPPPPVYVYDYGPYYKHKHWKKRHPHRYHW